MDRDRRRVVRDLLLGAAGVAAGGTRARASGPAAGPSRGPVVARARRAGMVDAKGAVDPAKREDAAAAAVARAVGERDAVEAMRRLFRPRDVVGIKVNCLGGRGMSPDPALAAALAGWIVRAGVPAGNVVIFDMREPHLVKAGYTIERGGAGVRCIPVTDDFEKTPREWGGGGSCFARILVEDLTALINLGVLKDHDLAGVSVGLKNWYGVIHNPNKFHDGGCNPYVAKLAAFPLIRDKVRLTVVDAAVAQCHGGPARSPRWAWPYGAVLASTDPVATDAFGWSVIEARRKEVGLEPLAAENREPRFIAEAEKLGLGVADLARIRVEDA